MTQISSHSGQYFEDFVLNSEPKIIPLYQRPYVWDKGFVNRYWDGITQSNEDDPLFIGTIILMNRGKEGVEIVDGQQRLSTSIIFLSALKDFGYYYHGLTGKEAENAKSISDEIRFFSPGRNKKPRFLPSKSLFEVFNGVILSSAKLVKDKTCTHEQVISYKLGFLENASYQSDENQQVLKNYKQFILSIFKEFYNSNGDTSSVFKVKYYSSLVLYNRTFQNELVPKFVSSWSNAMPKFLQWIHARIDYHSTKTSATNSNNIKRDLKGKLNEIFYNELIDSVVEQNFYSKKLFGSGLSIEIPNLLKLNKSFVHSDSHEELKKLDEQIVNYIKIFYQIAIVQSKQRIIRSKLKYYRSNQVQFAYDYDSDFDDFKKEMADNLVKWKQEYLELRTHLGVQDSKLSETLKLKAKTLSEEHSKGNIKMTFEWKGAFNIDSQSIESVIKEFENDSLEKYNEKCDMVVTDFMQDLLDKSYSLQFVKIELKDEDDDKALEIFETVNDAGVELSVEDLLKNVIFRKIKNHEQSDSDWTQLITNLTDSSLSIRELVRYYWASRYNYVSDRKLFKEMKLNLGPNTKRWEAFVKELLDISEIFKIIDKANYGVFTNYLDTYIFSKNSISRQYEWLYEDLFILRNSGTSLWSILYMAIVANLPILQKEIRSEFRKKLKERLSKFVKFSYIYYAILKEPSNFYFSQMHKHSQLIWKSVDSKKYTNIWVALDSLLTSLETKIIENEHKIDDGIRAHLNSLTYTESKKEKLKAMFYIIQSQNQKIDKTIDFSLFTIEHIVPQKPSSGWKIKKNQIRPFVNSVGNLTLLESTINGERENKTIKESLPLWKKSILEENKTMCTKIEKGVWEFETLVDTDNKGVNARFDYLSLMLKEWIKKL